MANQIGFSGVGSGIDFNAIRDAILAVRSRPITLLQAKSSEYNSRIEGLKQLNSSLAILSPAAEALTSRELGSGRSISSSDPLIASATGTNAAALGAIDLNVTRLATTLSQASRSYTATNTPILVGGATTATFELRKGDAATGKSITIDSTNNSLAGLRDAINAANAGVTASIVDLRGDGTQQQLILNSKETGAAGRVQLVETTSTGTGADLNLRSLNPPDGDFSTLDAKFSLNGLEVTRSTNTVSDAVNGVTLTLKKAGGSTSLNVTPSSDIENRIRGLVTAYNGVQDFIAGQYKKDAKGKPTGALAGEQTLRSVQQQLTNAVNGESTTNGGTFTRLSDIGLRVEQDGKLTLDSTVLSEKLKTNPDDVKALLFGKTASQTGIAHSIKTAITSLSDTVTGTVQTAIKGYETSVANIGNSISKRLELINQMRDSMTRQFAAADAAIGQLNSQGTALKSVVDSLKPRES